MTHIVRRILGIERERKMLMIMAKEKTKWRIMRIRKRERERYVYNTDKKQMADFLILQIITTTKNRYYK